MGGGGGGGGIEHLEAVCAMAHTLLSFTTILCCVNTVKVGCAPLWGNTDIYASSNTLCEQILY